MPVNYATPTPISCLRCRRPPRRRRSGNPQEKPARPDAGALDPGCTVAGVFTQNRFCAAPVQLCREHLAAARKFARWSSIPGSPMPAPASRAVRRRRRPARRSAPCLALAPTRCCRSRPASFSNPCRSTASRPACRRRGPISVPINWHAAAHAIMTTDTVAKAASRTVAVNGKKVTISGISKGAGHDQAEHGDHARLSRHRRRHRPAAARRAGQGGGRCLVQLHHRRWRHLDQRLLRHDRQRPVRRVFSEADAGWAEVKGGDHRGRGRTGAGHRPRRRRRHQIHHRRRRRRQGREECRKVGYAIGHSPLVKTAFFASDPNLGRILAAIGYAGIADLDVDWRQGLAR
jgi:glutamate N-acetyltransferase/amino-acid N-acetyltransferase